MLDLFINILIKLKDVKLFNMEKYPLVWKWRDGEISHKSFIKLSTAEKEKHIDILLQLNKEDLSSNDIAILNYYFPNWNDDEPVENFYSI